MIIKIQSEEIKAMSEVKANEPVEEQSKCEMNNREQRNREAKVKASLWRWALLVRTYSKSKETFVRIRFKLAA